MMCTDGLTDMLSSEEIKKILHRNLVLDHKGNEETAKALISGANKKGGIDNITVVIIQVQEVNESKNLSRQ
jgi:serine/threonine protein phosphatase PrpC